MPQRTIAEFVSHWRKVTVTEKAGAQSHFTQLCDVLSQPAPLEADPTGTEYAFEKHVSKTLGGKGYADVWKRGKFAWEYKGKHKDLKKAYAQLLDYREDLENPPLLVVCDLENFEVHTNFTDSKKRVYAFQLEDLLTNTPLPSCALPPLDVLRALFTDPNRLRADRAAEYVTEEAAREFGKIAQALTGRGAEPHVAAHFLIRLLFALFAEDTNLLPAGLFTRLLEGTRARPAEFGKRLSLLFQEMATGGSFGADDIKHFNGGLFADTTVLPLTEADLNALASAAKLDWSSIEPSIFGTLFERSLDPGKRSQLGAHYTSRADILLIVEPVLMAPLRRRWQEVREGAQTFLDRRKAVQDAAVGPLTPTQRGQITAIEQNLAKHLRAFTEELAAVRVLDPACGSGNFLYVALRGLLDLEKEVIHFAAASDLTGFFPTITPEQMRGIELNEYAHALASTTVWIGYIQWLQENGFGQPQEPILRGMDFIENRDALLTVSPDGTAAEAGWPDADVIIGNPPFLGDKKMRAELGDDYTNQLRAVYSGRVPGGADLVTYWFEKARALIQQGQVKRVGLLSTNGIRYGANRQIVDRIKATGDIFMGWSDRGWVLDGADVRVSMVGFDNGAETERALNGAPVTTINPDLTAQVDVTAAKPLAENEGIAFLGMMKGGPFDIDDKTAQAMLSAPLNVNGRPNSDVVKRRLGGQDITGRYREGWIIDFGATMTEAEAAYYELPFAFVQIHVKPLRDTNNRERMKRLWWIHGEARPGLRKALATKSRCIVTPEVSKYRIFVWMPTNTIPDHTCHVLARDDDYFFGVLHSRLHEIWSLAVGNRMGVGNDPRYNSSRTFGTFPLPWLPGTEPAETDSPTVRAIADAARNLVQLRDNWLTPPDADPATLKTRTLTNLYNARPTWLTNAHAILDNAVFAAYAQTSDPPWPDILTDDEILARLLTLNHQRAAKK